MGMQSSEFYCTSCGEKTINVYRKEGQNRGPGHLKKLYCYKCKTTHNCVEIKPFGKYTLEDFKIEFLNGNFTKDGDRIESWTSFVKKYGI